MIAFGICVTFFLLYLDYIFLLPRIIRVCDHGGWERCQTRSSWNRSHTICGIPDLWRNKPGNYLLSFWNVFYYLEIGTCLQRFGKHCRRIIFSKRVRCIEELFLEEDICFYKLCLNNACFQKSSAWFYL